MSKTRVRTSRLEFYLNITDADGIMERFPSGRWCVSGGPKLYRCGG